MTQAVCQKASGRASGCPRAQTVLFPADEVMKVLFRPESCDLILEGSEVVHGEDFHQAVTALTYRVKWKAFCVCACVCVPAGIRASLVYFEASECDSSMLWCGRCLPRGWELTQANTRVHIDMQTAARRHTWSHANTDTCCTCRQSLLKELGARSQILAKYSSGFDQFSKRLWENQTKNNNQRYSQEKSNNSYLIWISSIVV